MIKMIPRPIGIGWYKDSICFLSEAGEIDFGDYIHYNKKKPDFSHNIEKICYQIYRDLFTINEVPEMNLCFKHCDMKPYNIVLTKTLYPLIIDFGFSIFKIDDISFIRPNTKKIEDTYTCFTKYYNDIYMNSIFDMVVLLYNIIYTYKIRVFDYIPKDKKFILCYENLYTLYNNISTNIMYQNYKEEDGFLHYLLVGEIIHINNMIKDYNFMITPTMLLDFLPSYNKKEIEYNSREYYKKYIKYKIKYMKLVSL